MATRVTSYTFALTFAFCPLTFVLLLPAIRQNGADARDAAAATSQDVFETCAGLFEQPLVLERFAQHHAEHRSVACVGDSRDAIPPAGDERTQELGVGGQNVPVGRHLPRFCRRRR